MVSIKSQIITKDQITGALDVSVAIDNRFITAAFENEEAKNKLISEQKNLGKNLATEGKFWGEGLEPVFRWLKYNFIFH